MTSHAQTAGVPLSELVRVRRRYGRSINLERDVTSPDSLDGYLVSSLAVASAQRIYSALLTRGAPKAWTVTGVYGTGKSAFAHFLLALSAPAADNGRRAALRLLAMAPDGEGVARKLRQRVPPLGFVRAVATGQREALAITVLRALERGVALFWAGRGGRRPRVAEGIRRALSGRRPPSSHTVLTLVREAAVASNTGLLLIVDELGKVLEHAARGAEADDVYLLQQLAELTADPEIVFGFVGVLHQGFGEYGALLPTDRRTEWLKVQGRFEDVAFAEPPDQMLRLAASAIEDRLPDHLARWQRRASAAWHRLLSGPGFHPYVAEALTEEAVASVLPLHPVAAFVLPALCAKYAQNDRSLFTFLASQEPHAFGRFLSERRVERDHLPLQRLDDIYDYFAGIAGQSLGFRPQFQRWAEVHAVVSDARSLDADSITAIKVVAALNLAAASGPMRASAALTLAALTERPGDAGERSRWEGVLRTLVDRGLVTYRRQLDEYRLWEGSDYDVEAAIRARVGTNRVSLAAALGDAVPLGAVVAQRHSYRTGTLRFFEAHYADKADFLLAPACRHADSDGLLIYWVGREAPPAVAPVLADGRPLALVEATQLAPLADAASEYLALTDMVRSDAHLQADGVARREVRHRLRNARTILERAVRESLSSVALRSYIGGATAALHAAALRARLSEACDQVYSQSPVLWNELLNRRELTSQGARARRELIEAMLHAGDRERLGLSGDGPEVSMYTSVLERTGVHRFEGGRWVFGAPRGDSGIQSLWDAMLAFCRSAESPRGVDELFAMLEAPPFGTKRGVLPVLLAAVLLAHSESISVFREGSFVPTLGAEHFEILVKHPGKFAVKHFALDGLRAEIFRDLADILRAPGAHAPTPHSATILGVVRPLVRFVASLPACTLKTRELTAEALAVRQALQTAREPDTLLFAALPMACGIGSIGLEDPAGDVRRATFRATLRRALSDLQSFPDRRREECAAVLAAAFGRTGDVARLRPELGARARALRDRPVEHRLGAFVRAAAAESGSDQEWLEALMMVVADRPFRSWDDAEAAQFEARVVAVARRFAAFEAVHAALVVDGGDEVRHVAITGSDGTPREQVVRFAPADHEAVRAEAGDLAARLRLMPPGQRAALLVMLTESVLAPGDSGGSDAQALHASPTRTPRPLATTAND